MGGDFTFYGLYFEYGRETINFIITDSTDGISCSGSIAIQLLYLIRIFSIENEHIRHGHAVNNASK